LDLSWALAVFYIVSGIMYIVVGRYVDKNKKEKEIMILGYALNTLATFGYIFISTPFQLLILQAIFGLSSALATPAWNKIFAETENENNAGLLWGLNDGTSSIVLGFGVIIGGYIIYLYSFNVLFIIMGSISLWATIVQAQIFKIEASNNQKDYLFSN
jgi:MFS family permease